MTRTVTRLSAVGVAAVLGIATLGCGFISKAKQTVDNLSTITTVAKKLQNAEKLTFTAQYQMSGGLLATVVQQPPNSAFIGKNSKFIVTKDALLMCETTSGKTTCQRSTNVGGDAGDHAALSTAAAGNGFVSAPMVFAVLTAASVIPGVKVTKNDKTIAGVKSECLKVTGIPKDTNQTTGIEDFSVCISNDGVLTSFSGTDTSGKQSGVTITKYHTTADANAFLPPAGARIVDVDQIQPGR